MIGFKAYRNTPTTLDLNGPILSYTTQPVSVTETGSSTINLVGIATALPVGTGSISYQWYETGYGPIASGSSITGTATTTLTLNELNFNDSGREFYLEASYEASAYGTSDPITAGTARSTGNAVNAPLVSDTVEITVGPTIVILQQPLSATVAIDQHANFSVLASIGSSTGAGVPAPCIAVIDECNLGQEFINDNWTAFRNKWPTRPFWIFRVPRRGSDEIWGIVLPSVEPTDYNVEDVNRDEGTPGGHFASDWFNLANLSGYVAGSTVTLWIDNSGSMTPASVANSYNRFVSDCAAAGILIDEQNSNNNNAAGQSSENYIWPFIDNLTGGGVPADPNLIYQWKVDGVNPDVFDNPPVHRRPVEGASTRILTMSESPAGIHTVACSISYEGAVNSPLLSNVVHWTIVDSTTPRSILHLEEFDVNATLYNTEVVNLEDGALEIIPSDVVTPTSNWNRIYSINAPEEDVTVKITMTGASGGAGEGPHSGGGGGTSTWTMTLTRQQEYVVNLGARIWPSGGQPAGALNSLTARGSSGGGQGGGGSFFYQGGELLVACGGGGGASLEANGGGGLGGGVGNEPDLTLEGSFAWLDFFGQFSTITLGELQNQVPLHGGQVTRCTIGDYWRDVGIPPCVSIGSTTFFTGQRLSNPASGPLSAMKPVRSTSVFTTPVTRGYKAGLNYQFNGGTGWTGAHGGGGGGAKGGDGGSGPLWMGGGKGGWGFASIPIMTASVGSHTGVVGTIKIEKA